MINAIPTQSRRCWPFTHKWTAYAEPVYNSENGVIVAQQSRYCCRCDAVHTRTTRSD